MRRIESWEEFAQTVEFFADSADEYHCHFLLLSEMFTAQLVYLMKRTIEFREAIQVCYDIEF